MAAMLTGRATLPANRPFNEAASLRSGTIMKPSATGKIEPGSGMQSQSDPYGLWNGDLAFARKRGNGHNELLTRGKELWLRRMQVHKPRVIKCIAIYPVKQTLDV